MRDELMEVLTRLDNQARAVSTVKELKHFLDQHYPAQYLDGPCRTSVNDLVRHDWHTQTDVYVLEVLIDDNLLTMEKYLAPANHRIRSFELSGAVREMARAVYDHIEYQLTP